MNGCDTTTTILFTDFIQRMNPTKVTSTPPSRPPPPDIRHLFQTVPLRLTLGTVSSSVPLFHSSNLPTSYTTSEPSSLIFDPASPPPSPPPGPPPFYKISLTDLEFINKQIQPIISYKEVTAKFHTPDLHLHQWIYSVSYLELITHPTPSSQITSSILSQLNFSRLHIHECIRKPSFHTFF